MLGQPRVQAMARAWLPWVWQRVRVACLTFFLAKNRHFRRARLSIIRAISPFWTPNVSQSTWDCWRYPAWCCTPMRHRTAADGNPRRRRRRRWLILRPPAVNLRILGGPDCCSRHSIPFFVPNNIPKHVGWPGVSKMVRQPHTAPHSGRYLPAASLVC